MEFVDHLLRVFLPFLFSSLRILVSLHFFLLHLLTRILTYLFFFFPLLLLSSLVLLLAQDVVQAGEDFTEAVTDIVHHLLSIFKTLNFQLGLCLLLQVIHVKMQAETDLMTDLLEDT